MDVFGPLSSTPKLQQPAQFSDSGITYASQCGFFLSQLQTSLTPSGTLQVCFQTLLLKMNKEGCQSQTVSTDELFLIFRAQRSLSLLLNDFILYILNLALTESWICCKSEEPILCSFVMFLMSESDAVRKAGRNYTCDEKWLFLKTDSSSEVWRSLRLSATCAGI